LLMKSFNINVNISNTLFPNSFQHLGVTYGQITNNKFWELEHFFDLDNMFLSKISYKTECDHAGLELMVALLGYNISFRTYDCRHWNEEEKCWETYFS
jgi:hypothetical protein